MGSEGTLIKLGDLVAHKKGFAFKSVDYQSTGIPVVRVSNFTDNSISPEDLKFVSEEVASKNSEVALTENDIVVATVGSWPTNPASVVGRTISVPAWASGALMNQNSVTLRARSKNQVDQRFLYFCMKSADFATHAVSKAQGSANQASITLDAIFSFPVWWPNSAARQDIVAILDSLDSRINLLRETNATLEAIAQTLFKSWFVDFDPVRAKMEGRAPEGMDEATAALFPDWLEESELGAVPRGWQVLPVGDAIDAVGGATPDTKNANYWEPALHYWTTPKDLSGIASPVLLKTERKLSNEGLAKIGSGLLPVGTLLLSSRAPIGYLALAQVPMAINQGYIAMPPGGLLPPLYMLYWCQQNMETIKGRANGSTFMEISKRAFRPIPALLPSQVVIEKFMEIATTLVDRVIENTRKFETLATLRDTLLPRLISGQLRLSDVEAQIEAIAA